MESKELFVGVKVYLIDLCFFLYTDKWNSFRMKSLHEIYFKAERKFLYAAFPMSLTAIKI